MATGCPIHQAPFGPGEAVERRGPEGVHEMVELGRAPFSDLAVSIEVEPMGDGEMVAARWVARGKYGGGVPDVTAPAGIAVEFGGIDMMRVEQGKIAGYWVSSDGAHLMAQLGML